MANCGIGPGGFKHGNKCGCENGSSASKAPPTGKQSDPAVQLAHQRNARSERRESDSHSLNVSLIRDGKDAKGLIAKHNPKAKADADALASYEPAKGHVAVGRKPARPSLEQAKEIARISHKQSIGKSLNDRELNAIANRDASHIQTSGGFKHSESNGHQYLVHNKTTGKNEVFTDADLRSSSKESRAAKLGTSTSPSSHVPIRQFNSQGVEVELNHGRYRDMLDPEVAVKRASDHKLSDKVIARERKAAEGVNRAKFHAV